MNIGRRKHMLIGLFTGEVTVVRVLISIFAVMLCLTVHEVAHGFAAYKLGDSTAKNMGRLTLNPIPHIDIIGGLALLFFGFGWAKPVIVDPRNFKRKISMRTGMAITAFAGPLSNLLFAFVSLLTLAIFWSASIAPIFDSIIFASTDFMMFARLELLELSVLQNTTVLILRTLVVMNLGLATFNLIPVPPLDGSKILAAFLPNKVLFRYIQIERYGFFILILALNLPILRNGLGFIINSIYDFYAWVIQLLPFVG